MIIGRAIALGSLAILAIQIIRNAAVAEYVELKPEKAAWFWSGNPDVQIAQAMQAVGIAAREQVPVSSTATGLMASAARKAPLSAEPFLLRGAQEFRQGHTVEGAKNFKEAQRRDPRSMAAAYFLSSYYLRTGRVVQGLREATLFARLSPMGTRAIAPTIASFAKDPSNWQQIRALFREDDTIEDHVLMVLARDSRNTAAILALADSKHKTAGSPWLAPLLQSLVRNREYDRAHAVWASISPTGVNNNSLVYDPNFSNSIAPPPFNWELTSSLLGIAEREPGRGLHVIYYGKDSGILARQLLLLRAGDYQLQVASSGVGNDASLVWNIVCASSNEGLLSATLISAAGRSSKFEVPQNCSAQWLQLLGKPSDIPQRADVMIGSVLIK